MNSNIIDPILKSLKTYRTVLDGVSDFDFQSQVKVDHWSYGQVFSHIFGTSQMILLGLEDWENKSTAESTEPTWISRIILFLGVLPGRIKAPKTIEEMVQNISKDEAAIQLRNFTQTLDRVMLLLPTIPKDRKFKHPKLGMLNAKEWLRFIEIHTRHHEKQLLRMGKF